MQFGTNSDVDAGVPSDLSAGGDCYPSDLRDAEWARLEPLIPKASPGGRPPNTDMRAAMNAILYLLRTGCPWRYLPHDRFPLRPTVYNIFRKFRRDGILRERMGREASPSAAVLDARSVKSANRQNRGGNDNQVGYNAGKQVKGRPRADPCGRLSRTLLGPSGAEWINACRGNAMNSKGARTGFILAQRRS